MRYGRLFPAPVKRQIRDVAARVQRFRHRGTGCDCNVCGSEWARFLATPDPEDWICPGCGCHSRHRLLLLYLQQTPLWTNTLTVLHFAPEAFIARHLRARSRLTYLSADLDPALADLQLDITAIALPDASVDVVLCYHVLEHIPDDAQALREVYRILRPGGWALLQPPIDYDRATTYEDPTITSPEDRLRHFNQADHVRVYGRDYPERVRAAGFTLTVDPFVQSQDAARYGLDRRELIYCAGRPGPA